MADQSESEVAFYAHLKLSVEAPEYETARIHLDAAIALLGALTAEHRQNFEAIAMMYHAIVAEQFGDYATSAEYNRRLVKADPNDLASQLGLMRAAHNLGNPQEAQEALRRSGSIAEETNNTAMLAMLATIGYLPDEEPARSQRIDEGIHGYRQALETEKPLPSSKRYATIQYGLGKLYGYRAEGLAGPERVQALRDALEAFRSALPVFSAERFPEDHRVLMKLLLHTESQLSLSSLN